VLWWLCWLWWILCYRPCVVLWWTCVMVVVGLWWTLCYGGGVLRHPVPKWLLFLNLCEGWFPTACVVFSSDLVFKMKSAFLLEGSCCRASNYLHNISCKKGFVIYSTTSFLPRCCPFQASSGMSDGGVAGIAVGLFFAGVFITLIICWVAWKKKNSSLSSCIQQPRRWV